MRKLPAVFLLLAVLSMYGFLHHEMWAQRAELRQDTPAGYVLPSRYSRILSFGHKGLSSDYLFLKAVTFFGGRTLSNNPLTATDWDYFITSLDAITDLDPYFLDPYMLAEGLLAWDAGMPDAANRLLEKGASYRRDDWRLPFFIGFNSFYFLQDYGKGSEYIMRAAAMSGSPAYFTTLAARLAYYGGKSKTALLFLQQMLADTSDPILRRKFKLRMLALERASLIEDALASYRLAENKDNPGSLDELVTKGYLSELPEDPYGGKWGVLKNGRVFSTSKFVEKNIKPESGE